MPPRLAWFKRQFDFTFPIELYPNVLSRLRGTPARLEDLLCAVPATILTNKPNGKWSAQEHAGHLLDIEPLWLVRINDFLVRNHTLAVADLSNRKTDEAQHNTRAPVEILAAFRQARLHLLARLAQLTEHHLPQTLQHPRLGTPMRLIDHLYFVAEHDDHHLAAIWELIEPAAL